MKTLILFTGGLVVSLFALANLSPAFSSDAIAVCSTSLRPNSSLWSFINNLFTTEFWPARWECGNWSKAEGWIYIASDLTIVFSYFSIPVLLLWYSRNMKLDKQSKSIFALFGAFIFLCGLTHLVDIILFWEPIYRVSLVSKLFTGIVSISTAAVLGVVIPLALKYKSPAQVEEEMSAEVKLRNSLKETNKELEAFTYSVSHDLRAPLRAIIGYMEIIQERTRDVNLPEGTNELINRTNFNAQRMDVLIKELLKYSQISHRLLQVKSFSLNEMLRSISENYFLKHVPVINIQDDMPSVEGDPYLIETVFMNLISNAIKYSSKNEKPIIDIKAMEDAGSVAVSIVDNGIGIDMIHEDRVFEVFERLHRDDRYEGTGVGLAICKKIMQRHNGEIWFESELGKGTTFFLRFRKQQSS